jgi:uncharacterized protein YecT (DUF1311 family)
MILKTFAQELLGAVTMDYANRDGIDPSKRFRLQAVVAATCLICMGSTTVPYSHAYRLCSSKASTQNELTYCANAEAERADHQLQAVYASVLSGASTPVERRKIAKMEAAWQAYRDAYVESLFPMEDKRIYGTVFPMEADLVRAKLNIEHIQALRYLGEHGSGHAVR